MMQQSRNASPHSRVPRHPTNRVRLPHVLQVTPLGCLAPHYITRLRVVFACRYVKSSTWIFNSVSGRFVRCPFWFLLKRIEGKSQYYLLLLLLLHSCCCCCCCCCLYCCTISSLNNLIFSLCARVLQESKTFVQPTCHRWQKMPRMDFLPDESFRTQPNILGHIRKRKLHRSSEIWILCSRGKNSISLVPQPHSRELVLATRR